MRVRLFWRGYGLKVSANAGLSGCSLGCRWASLPGCSWAAQLGNHRGLTLPITRQCPWKAAAEPSQAGSYTWFRAFKFFTRVKCCGCAAQQADVPKTPPAAPGGHSSFWSSAGCRCSGSPGITSSWWRGQGAAGCSWDLLSASAASTSWQRAGDKQGEEAQRSQHRAQHPPDAWVPLGVAGFQPQLLRCRDASLLRLPNFLAEGTGSTHPPRGRSSQPPRGAPGVTQRPGTGSSGRGAPGAAAAASPALGAAEPSRDAAAFGRAPGTGGPAAGGPGGGGGSRGRPRPAPPPPPAPSPAPPEPRPQPGPGVREGPEGRRSE